VHLIEKADTEADFTEALFQFDLPAANISIYAGQPQGFLSVYLIPHSRVQRVRELF
jgi:hypothetical protein